MIFQQCQKVRTKVRVLLHMEINQRNLEKLARLSGNYFMTVVSTPGIGISFSF